MAQLPTAARDNQWSTRRPGAGRREAVGFNACMSEIVCRSPPAASRGKTIHSAWKVNQGDQKAGVTDVWRTTNIQPESGSDPLNPSPGFPPGPRKTVDPAARAPVASAPDVSGMQPQVGSRSPCGLTAAWRVADRLPGRPRFPVRRTGRGFSTFGSGIHRCET